MLSCEHVFWMGSYQIWDFWLHGVYVCVCSGLSTYTHRPWGVRLGNSVNSVSELLSLSTRSVDESFQGADCSQRGGISPQAEKSAGGTAASGPCLPITAAALTHGD